MGDRKGIKNWGFDHIWIPMLASINIVNFMFDNRG